MPATQENMILEATRRALVSTKGELRSEIDQVREGLVGRQTLLEERSTDARVMIDRVLAEIDRLHQRVGSLGGEQSENNESLRTELSDALGKALVEINRLEAQHVKLCEDSASNFAHFEKEIRPEIIEEVSNMIADSRRMLNEAISGLQLDAFDDRLRTVAECQDELSARADLHGDDINAHSNLLRKHGADIALLDDRTKDTLSELTRTVRELASHVSEWAQGGPAYRAQATVKHRGGVWLAKRQTHEEPGTGEDWLLVMNGVNVCTIAPDPEDVTGSSYSFVVEDTAGNQIISRATLPTPNFLKTWEPGRYCYMDSVIKDGHRWLCVAGYTSDEPGKSNDWRMMAMRGAQGRKGEKGERGLPGEKGDPGQAPSMNKVLQHWIDYLQQDGGTPVTRYMGKWALNGKYRPGDLVDFRGQPRLCVRDMSGAVQVPDAPDQKMWASMGSPPPAPPPTVRSDRVLIAREVRAEVTRGYALAIPLDEKYSRIEFTLTTWGHSLEINSGKGGGTVYADISLSKWDENNRVWCEVAPESSEKIEWCDRGATSLQGHLVRVPGTDEWQGMFVGTHNANDDNARPSSKARRITLNGMIGACPGEQGESIQFGFGSAPGEHGRVHFEAWGLLI